MEARHPSLFLFGPERSGTTLLTFLLSGQPNIFVLNDSFVFDQFVEWALMKEAGGPQSGASRAIRLAKGLAPFVRADAIQSLTSRRRIYYRTRCRYAMSMEPSAAITAEQIRGYYHVLGARYRSSLENGRESFLNDYVKGLQQPEKGLPLRDLLSSTITSISRLFTGNNSVLLGEKTPLHTPYFAWVRRLYPDSKVVLVVRDPIANVASIYKRYGDFNRAVRAYDMYAESVMGITDRSDALVVRHEDVTSSTADTLRRVVGFLDPELEFDASCPVNAYTKSAYTGQSVDRNRSETSPGTLDEGQRKRVAKRFRHVTERFYEGERF